MINRMILELNQLYNHVMDCLNLKLAGIIFLLILKIEKIASTLPAAPNKCPIDDLVELILSLLLFICKIHNCFNSISSPKLLMSHVHLYNQFHHELILKPFL